MLIEKFEIETVLADDTVLEQGSIHFKNSIFVSTMVFKKINCNYDNMTIFLQQKEKSYQKPKRKTVDDMTEP